MGNGIKIEDSGKSGTWASQQGYREGISKWISENPEWVMYNSDNTISGYVSEMFYKDNAKILRIHDMDSFNEVLNKYGNGIDSINWNNVAKDFDAVRINNASMRLSNLDYYLKVMDYHGDTDVIFNKNAIETVFTFNAQEYVDDIFANPLSVINNAKQSKKYKPIKGPKLKQTKEILTPQQAFKKTIEQTTNEMINNTTKKVTKALPKKSLGGNGKLAIGLAVAGAIIGVATITKNKDDDNKNNKQRHNLPNTTSSYANNYIDNSQAMQMAQDISSYRYGKHITGFVNF